MLVQVMLQNQCDVQQVLAHRKGKMVLPTADAILIAQHVDTVLVNYSLLANWADKAGHLLFNVAPKHYDLWHMGQQARYLNPKKSNIMLYESSMGVINDLAKSCSRGSDPHKIHLNCVEKHRWALHFDFSG